MSPVPVMITATPRIEGDDISFIDNVDTLGSAEVMLGTATTPVRSSAPTPNPGSQAIRPTGMPPSPSSPPG